MALIGLCGAHRTGKSTLARELAKYGFEYVDAGVSKVLSDNGFDPESIQELGYVEFYMAQKLVLEHIMEIAYECSRDLDNTYVMDRTPLDALAYFQCFFNGRFCYRMSQYADDEGENFRQNYERYTEMAYSAAHRYVCLIQVQPGIQLVKEKGKALADEVFIEQLNTLLLGDASTLDLEYPSSPFVFIMPRNIIDMNQRVNFVTEAWRWCVDTATEGLSAFKELVN